MGTDNIKDLDGLPAGEIRLLVNEAENRINATIDERFTEQDMKISSMQQEVSVLVGTAKLTGWVQETKKAVDKLTENSMKWHDDDMDYRSEMKDRMVTIETNTTVLTKQVDSISWFVKANNGLAWSIRKAMLALKQTDLWKLIVFAFVLWMTAHFAPHLYTFIQHTATEIRGVTE